MLWNQIKQRKISIFESRSFCLFCFSFSPVFPWLFYPLFSPVFPSPVFLCFYSLLTLFWLFISPGVARETDLNLPVSSFDWPLRIIRGEFFLHILQDHSPSSPSLPDFCPTNDKLTNPQAKSHFPKENFFLF